MEDKRSTNAGEPSEVDLGRLPGRVGYVVRRAYIFTSQQFNVVLAPVDLRPAEYATLLIIQHNPGLRQGRVAEALGIQPPNLAVLLGRLVSRGLVERRESASDRRAVALHLTCEGEALIAQANTLEERLDSRFTSRLGEAGRAQLLALLRKLMV